MLKNNQTHMIYLIGTPGTGKYTISQELAKEGYIICDNQLVNNPIFSLLNYNGLTKIPKFAWDAIGKIRKNVFDFVVEEPNNNYVLTNVLYDEPGDQKLYRQVQEMASKRNSLFIPVKLLISQEENVKRISQPSRRLRWKSIDPRDLTSKPSLINISHPHLLEVDVTHLAAAEVANKILGHIEKCEFKA